jgi:DEAD/DEAH box helicase domain-containing protein
MTLAAATPTPLVEGPRWDQPQVVHVEHLPPVAARTARLRRPVPAEVGARLPVAELWAHQAQAIDLVRDGQSVVIATGTASGKSLCYQLPVAEAVAGDPPGTAVALFPTKALAHDQLRAISAPGYPGLVAGAYDGDCGPEERAWLRSHANVLLTNPEMLHHGILPGHARWATFLQRLRYVVVDELHTLRGIFGSHVSHLLRRLTRLAHQYGADPTFVFSSATIGQPGRLASELCGRPVTEVLDDASPRGPRTFVLWNPAAVASDQERRAPSARRDAAAIAAELVEHGHRTLAFGRSRKGTEVLAAEIRRRLPDHLAASVRAYRGGYLAEERRDIEQELADGALRCVVATTALELGVDIGGLDACVLLGFPGTVSSMWQQAGRAGRQLQPSLTVLVAGEDQLDQWLMAHPRAVFTRPPEPAVVNPSNPYVLFPQLACAAYERPLRRDDAAWWPDDLDEGIRGLVLADQVRLRRRREVTGPAGVWIGDGFPADGVGLRSGSAREVQIRGGDDLVGTVDVARAPRMVHPGASYLHQGQAYRVRELDLEALVATVEPDDGDEYTQPRSETTFAVVDAERHRRVGRLSLALGAVEVTTRVVGYRRFASGTGELLGTEDLWLPPSELVTRGFWYTVDPSVLDAARVLDGDVPGTLHAVEHAAIGLLPLFTICDRWDVGGVSTARHADTGLPTVVIYDGYPGGAGVAELGFDAGDDHLAATLELVEGCACDDGCPSCVQSPKCGNGNEPLDKAGAVALLRTALTQPQIA